MILSKIPQPRKLFLLRIKESKKEGKKPARFAVLYLRLAFMSTFTTSFPKAENFITLTQGKKHLSSHEALTKLYRPQRRWLTATAGQGAYLVYES